MGSRRRRLIACSALATAAIGASRCALAQSPASNTSRPRESSEPAQLDAVLATVQDFALNFDHPAFYLLVERMRSSPPTSEEIDRADVVSDWSTLLERPSDYRGRLITIEGLVGHNKSWQPLDPAQDHLGTLWQLELYAPRQPIAVTAVLTADAADIPLNASVRLPGRFMMIRRYPSPSDPTQMRHAALIVAVGPTSIVSSPRPADAAPVSPWLGFSGAALAGLLAAWLILRARVRQPLRSSAALHAPRQAPMNLADDLAEWASGGEAPPRPADAADSQPATPRGPSDQS
jgi:hypothetical protein